MKGSVKKAILLTGIAAWLGTVWAVKSLTAVKDFHEKYEGQDLTTDTMGIQREGTYAQYLQSHKEASRPEREVEVDLSKPVEQTDAEIFYGYEGADTALYTGEDSRVTFQVQVPQAGFYRIRLEYMAVEARGVSVERGLEINGSCPFEDAGNLVLQRCWTDGGQVRTDNQGNEIRPAQVEETIWQDVFLRDDMGYEAEPYEFYFEQGENTITLQGVNEPVVLRRLCLSPSVPLQSYREYVAENEQTGSEEAKEVLLVIQGEDSVRRSDASLYAKYDRSSPTTEPYSVTKTVLNYTGGEAWGSAGQWIEWEAEIPADGWYEITVKGRQNYSRGSVSGRALYIDGEIPFREAEELTFDYSNDWQYVSCADENGDPCRVWLTEGTHTLRLEATLGDMGAILQELEDSTYRLNQIYRKLLVYTGASPDKYRDYNIDQVYPEILDAMSLESMRLYKVVDDMVAYSGQKADKIAAAQTLAQQMERFVERPERITVEFTTFKDNITALGTAVLGLSETKLDVDYLVISGSGARVEKKQAGFGAMALHELKSFAASFVVDYDAVGDVYEEDDSDIVKVWVLTGRDQGTILKTMVDDTFTPDSGIKVNVEIVAADALLSAVVAGRGPDVVLSVGADQPVNYALRSAAEDLTQFDDYREVLSQFTESSYQQYLLDGGLYGLPETQTFNVMFYREDILEELGLTVPNTWKELIEMLPTIQGNNMSVGLPSAAGSSGSASASTSIASNAPDLSMYFSLLFQNGGDLYNEAGTQTVVDEEAGVEAFADYTSYFTDYGLPTIYDFVSRFRSGEMPIGIMNYSTYNTLTVSAPEIRGLWDFTLIPGTEKIDENGETYIDRSDFITGTATMMIKTDDQQRKENAWEFMKWWASADTQARFGREIEALLGSSARYATANTEAFSMLGWSSDDMEILREQWQQTVGIREVPGGYYTGRHISNAIRKVINDKDDPRETILDYAITIDEEIDKKRTEFGMTVE